MNDPEGFDALSPAERVMLLEALRDHVKKLKAAARSNDEVANTFRMFQTLAQKLEAMVEPNAHSLRTRLASASHNQGHNRLPKGKSRTKKAKGKNPAQVE